MIQSNVYNLSGQVLYQVEIPQQGFSEKLPRPDILALVIKWQLARRRQGNSSTKTFSTVAGSTRKMYRQKGTGRARHGADTAVQFVGGGISFGPQVRDYEYKLNKKVKQLGLRMALSVKFLQGCVIIVDGLNTDSPKTKALKGVLDNMGIGMPALVIFDAKEEHANFKQGIHNLQGVNMLPCVGLNVYDIMRHNTLIVTTAALKTIQERFGYDKKA